MHTSLHTSHQKYTGLYTAIRRPGKGTYANSPTALSGQMHTSQEQHTCGAHGRAQSGLPEDTQAYILTCVFPLIIVFSLTFSRSVIPGVPRVSITGETSSRPYSSAKGVGQNPRPVPESCHVLKRSPVPECFTFPPTVTSYTFLSFSSREEDSQRPSGAVIRFQSQSFWLVLSI